MTRYQVGNKKAIRQEVSAVRVKEKKHRFLGTGLDRLIIGLLTRFGPFQASQKLNFYLLITYQLLIAPITTDTHNTYVFFCHKSLSAEIHPQITEKY